MTGKSKGKKTGRWRRLIKAGLFILVLALVGVLVAPKLVVRQVVEFALTAFELEPVAFEVDSVDLQKLVFANVTLGAGPDFAADQIEVSYKITDLWRGKLDGIRLLRPKLRAITAPRRPGSGDQSLSLGVFDQILFGEDAAAPGPGLQVQNFVVEDGILTLVSAGEVVITSRLDVAYAPGGQSELFFEATGGPNTPDLFGVGRLSATDQGLQSATLDVSVPQQIDLAGWRVEGAELQLDFDTRRPEAAGKLAFQVRSFALPSTWLERFERFLKSSDETGDWISGFNGLALSARASLEPDKGGGVKGKLLEVIQVNTPNGNVNVTLAGNPSEAPDFHLTVSDEWQLDLNLRTEQSGASLPMMDLEVEATLMPAAREDGVPGLVVRRLAGDFDGLQFGQLRIGARGMEVAGQGSLRNFAGAAKGGLLINGQLSQAFGFEQSVAQLDGSFEISLPGGVLYTHSLGACAQLESRNFRVIKLYLPKSKLNFCSDRKEPVIDLALGAGDASYLSFAASVTGEDVSITDQDRFTLKGALPQINLYTDFDIDQGDWSMAYELGGGTMIFGDNVSLLNDLDLSGVAEGSTDGIKNVEIDLTRMRVSSAGSTELFAPFFINGAMRTESRLGVFSGDLFDTTQRQMGGYSGEHDWRTQGGFLEFDTGILPLEPKGFQPQELFPVFANVMADANGAMRATGLIDWQDGSLTSNGEVELIDIDFASLVGPVSGVNSQIKLGSLLPLATLTPQRIDIQQIDVGVDLFFGEFLFSLMADGRVVLEEAVWPWAGGEIGFDRAALILDDTPQELGLFVRSVDLAEVFTLLDIDGLTGSGLLEGQLPIRVEDGGITVLDGVMTSLGGGTLQYQGPVSLSSEQDDGSKLMFDALEDFSYDVLRVSISGRTTDDLKVAIVLEGSNPAVLDGYPFKINISTEGPLAEMVRKGTIGYRVPEQIRKQLQ